MGKDNLSRRTIANEIFLAGIDSILPSRLIPGMVSLKDDNLHFGDLNFPLESIENIYVIGAGKASALMGFELEKILGDRITEGKIVVKYGHSVKLKFVDIIEAGHPVPDVNGFKTTPEILKVATKAGYNDIVICLLSGGGSSLMPDLPEGCTYEDLMLVNSKLVTSGASISEINTVRKHLSKVKGGQLARIVYPATLISLILSDVPGDNLDVIASGPTVPDPTTYMHALNVIADHGLTGIFPRGILAYLREGAVGKRPETPKPGDPVFEKTYNYLVGTNRMALEAAMIKALTFNINAMIIDDQL